MNRVIAALSNDPAERERLGGLQSGSGVVELLENVMRREAGRRLLGSTDCMRSNRPSTNERRV